MDDLISRQAAIDALDVLCQEHRYKIPGKAETYSQYNEAWQDALDRAEGAIGNLPSAQLEQQRTFIELVVEYPEPELCTYKEYRGKPYYSIKYIENGETHIGYGTYNPKVLSQYLSEYFISSSQPEIVRCKDCKWYGRADKRRFYRGMDCLQKRIDTIIPDKDFCSRAERKEE